MAELKSFLEGREPVTFVDLFAGAGGISEGFLQADANNKYYDFLHYLKGLVYKTTSKPMADAICYKFLMELEQDDKKANEYKDLFFDNLESQFKSLTRHIDYRVSKSDHNVNTIRHGLAHSPFNNFKQVFTA